MSHSSPRQGPAPTYSIQGRVTCRLLIGTLLAGVAANLGIYVWLGGEVREQYDAALKGRARAISALVIARSEAGPLTFPFAGRDQRHFRRPGHGDYFQIWDGGGRVVARSLSLGDDQALARPEIVETSIGDDVYDGVLPDGRPGRFIELRFAPLISDDGGFATSERAAETSLDQPARLVLATDRAELDDTMANFRRSLAIGAIALAAASTVIVVVVVRAGLRPLRRLADDAANVDAGQLDAHRFHTAGLPEELRPIAQRLNDLLVRVGAAFTRERRFTADAAHELRTPIAELRSLSEVALRWPPSTDAEHAANYQHLLAGAMQMEAVVDALLTLARHHAGERSTATFMSLPLLEIVAEAWRPFESAAADRGLRLRLDVAPAICVASDRAVLVALLRNLFSNVVSYAPRGSTASCIADDRTLHISNEAADLSPQDIEQVARPFWRKESARADRDEHVGLGLTLVAEYAAALRIDVAFTLDAGQFVATLTWPAPFAPTIDSPTPARALVSSSV